MAFSSCLRHPLMSFKPIGPWHNVDVDQRLTSALTSVNAELFGQKVAGIGTKLLREWSYLGGSRVIVRPQVSKFTHRRKGFRVHSSCLASSQIASTMLTWGTVAVLPFYTLMVFAPKAELTKKSMESNIPYVVLGLLYTYLLYLSWTPDTIQLIFASKYFLPELPGIARMFSSEMTLASAWLHLLAVDLFAARQVFHDGLQNEIEIRHSVSLCLFSCPIGILTHVITKALTRNT